MRLKRPAARIHIAAMLAIIAVIAAAAVSFLPAKPSLRLSGQTYETASCAAVGGGSDSGGVRLSLSAACLDPEPTTLTATLHNGTAYPITYGTDYLIFKLEKGAWLSCAVREDLSFDDIAYFLAPGHTNVLHSRNAAFDLTRTGIYRLEATFFFDHMPPVTKEALHKVWLDFEITGKPSGFFPFERRNPEG